MLCKTILFYITSGIIFILCIFLELFMILFYFLCADMFFAYHSHFVISFLFYKCLVTEKLQWIYLYVQSNMPGWTVKQSHLIMFHIFNFISHTCFFVFMAFYWFHPVKLLVYISNITCITVYICLHEFGEGKKFCLMHLFPKTDLN